MSRIGKQVIDLPAGTEVKVDGSMVTVKGKGGELSREFRDGVAINVADNQVSFSIDEENSTPFTRALWGTVASHVSNMITGVNEPFVKKLEVQGVGFRSEVKGDLLVLNIGFSHPVEVKIPSDLTVTAEKNVITVSGIDKELVGLFANRVKMKKKPEPYKGKGIKYQGEEIRRKQGKKSA